MAKHSKVLRPFTPVRKLFLGLFKPKPSNAGPRALGKRRRGEDPDLEPIVMSPRPLLSPKPFLMALQNVDTSSDAIIITALDTLPFCCHEDLITMARPQLVQAALTLNEKLPTIMHIDVNPSRPDSFIRNSIEVIVGLKRSVPPAPKSVRMHTVDIDFMADMSPPISPLSSRSRSGYYSAVGSPRLARLDEEDEDVFTIERPVKKRKVSASSSAASVSPVIDEPPQSYLLRTQSQSHCLPPSPTPAGKGKGFQRSQSLALPDNKIDTAFITTTRPRYRFRPRPMASRPVKTSTPISRKFKPLLDSQADGASASTSASSVGASEASPASTPPWEVSRVMRATRSVGDEEGEDDVTFGIDGMTIAFSCSDMDVSMT